MKTKLCGLSALLLFFVVQISFAQTKTVTGNVSDGSGMPLPGVNILIQGTTQGANTDFDGNYSITANVGDVLKFSFLGYKSEEIIVGDSTSINVTMNEDASTLDEVVVTALGIKRDEKAIGYSVQKIKGDGLIESREPNIVNSLSGRAAGIQVTSSSGGVGSSSRIILRGNSSITGNNEPLFVVDGVPMNNSSFGNAGSGGGVDLPNGVAAINPDDIESVTVLKGPNAAALYGVRAGNGVIVITTKSGSSTGKFSVSINSNVMSSNPLILPDFQNSYGQGSSPSYFEYVDGAGAGVADGVDESWGPALDAGFEFIQWNSQLKGGLPLPWVSRPDNVKDFFDTGLKLSNNLSLSAGSDVSSLRISLSKTNEQGMIPNTELNTQSITTSGKIDLGKKLHAGINGTWTNMQSDNLSTVGYNNENPMQQFIWSARQVDFKALRDWRNLPMAPAGTNAEGTPLNWNHNYQNNPYWVLDTNTNTYDRDRLNGNVFLTYDFTDWASLTAKTNMDHYTQKTTVRKGKGSNEYPEGYYSEAMRRYTEVNNEILLSINKEINSDFSFSFNAAANSMIRKYSSLGATAPQLELPNYYNVSNIKTGVTPEMFNFFSEQRINSIYAFGQVSFRDFAFIDFTARNDWASVLPTINNSFFYPSISGSLILSDAFEDLKSTFDFLKLRASWSKVGSNGALGPYNLNQTYSLNNTGFGNQASTPSTLFNPNLKSETVTGTEVGIDLRMFKSKLRFSATYYDQLSEDLLVPIQVSSATGFNSVWNNIGSMSNSGIEIQLGATIIDTPDFGFGVDINWAQNKNKVESLGELDTYILGGQWGVQLEARPGLPYGVLVGRGFERDPSGEVIYENGLPVIDQTPKVLGDIAPDWTGGVNFNLRYKNFTLSSLVDAKIGGEVHSMTYAWGRYAGVLEETLIGRETGVVGNGVQSDGNGGYIPNNVTVDAKIFNQSSYNNSVEESSIFDASYVKLRSVSIGYSIPDKLLENTFIDGVKLSLVGRNLAVLYRETPHIDPETGFSSANGEQGQEFGQLPSARSLGFNVNLQF